MGGGFSSMKSKKNSGLCFANYPQKCVRLGVFYTSQGLYIEGVLCSFPSSCPIIGICCACSLKQTEVQCIKLRNHLLCFVAVSAFLLMLQFLYILILWILPHLYLIHNPLLECRGWLNSLFSEERCLRLFSFCQIQLWMMTIHGF